MTGPDLSVVVVTHRSARTIGSCLDALDRARGALDAEIIVVDNASSDGTLEVIRRDHPEVTVVARAVNDGFARGCHAGVAVAKGRRLLFCNPDVVVASDALSAVVTEAESHPGAGIVGGRQVRDDGTTDPRSWWGRPTLWSALTFASGLSSRFSGRVLDPESSEGWDGRSRSVPVVSGGFMLVERGAWDALGGFDRSFLLYGEDADLCLRAPQAGWSPRVCGDAVFRHAVGSSTGADAADDVSAVAIRLQLVLRGRAALARARFGVVGPLAVLLLMIGTALRSRHAPVGTTVGAPRATTPRAAWAAAWRGRGDWSRGWPAGETIDTAMDAARAAVDPQRRTGTPRVLVIIQNMPYRFDRRVRHEVQALHAAGVDVAVICPKDTADEPDVADLDGATVYSYPAPPATSGVLSYLREFAGCWLQTARLSRRVWRDGRFDAIQACNPPDTYWALALLWRARGVRFVYDQHDLCPEVFVDRLGTGGRVARALHGGLLGLERMSYLAADHVIAPNPGYAEIARNRGRRRSDSITVVMSSPDPTAVRRTERVPDARRFPAGEMAHLVAYVGVMGPQDGVDRLLRAARHVLDAGRDDVGFVLMGFGDELGNLRAEATRLGLDGHVRFTGRLGHDDVVRWLSSADLGVTPDPRTAFTDRSTMNKTLEYMACELPVVATDLSETRRCAAEAAVYVETEADMAAAITRLLDEPDRRARMGAIGRSRIERDLRWERFADSYVAAYDKVIGLGQPVRERAVPVTRGILHG